MSRKEYPSDMNDAEWEIIKEILEKELIYTKGPKVTLEDYREILNAIFYLVKTGVQWKYLPNDFPPPTTVNYHYLKFARNGLLETINDALRAQVRKKKGKDETPSAGVIDSQSVKSTPEARGNEVGFDGGKKVNGRKRSLITDTLGYVIKVCVHAANVYDGDAGRKLLDDVCEKMPLTKIWADSTYRGEFVNHAEKTHQCEVEIRVNDKKQGFKPIKKRWVVERTFAWLTRNRRLAKEYEKTTTSSEAMVYLASIRLLLAHATE